MQETLMCSLSVVLCQMQGTGQSSKQYRLEGSLYCILMGSMNKTQAAVVHSRSKSVTMGLSSWFLRSLKNRYLGCGRVSVCVSIGLKTGEMGSR